MEQSIILNSVVVPYTLNVSNKAKRMRLAVHVGGKLRVTLPKRIPRHVMEEFILHKSEWVLRTILKLQRIPTQEPVSDNTKEYKVYKEKALILVTEKLAKFNTFYNFSYTGIGVKNQKTLWGSCSKRGKLNFNYKIALIPERLAEYIVVHELCHLGEFNHSQKFWNLVAKTIPDYLECRNQLKKTGLHFQ